MNRGKLISLSLLSLFLFSAAIPTILVNADIDVTEKTTTIYQQKIYDVDLDKIQDELQREIDVKGESIIDVAVVFDRPINNLDQFRLANLGTSLSGEIWDLGRRTKITTYSENLEKIASLPGVSLITSIDLRHILVAIEGDDFTDLYALDVFDDVLYFDSIGCAAVHYYSGIENDINLLGDYDLIGDITDINYYPDVEENTESTDSVVHTADTADYTNASSMWSLGYEGDSAKVGVIDTGINENHADFSGRVIEQLSFVQIIYGYDQDDPSTIDYSGHGSHVSGIIGGDGTTNSDNIGMAPQVSIYFAKIGDSSQEGSPATALSVIAAVDWLADDKNVDVINYSYGRRDYAGISQLDIAFRNAIKQEGCICVTSCGNSGDEGIYTVGEPSTCDDIIAVGNLDTSGGEPFEPAYLSSRGLTQENHMKPDVMAPGTSIVSCSQTGDGYITLSGTSMASPHVAGAAALLVDACKDNAITYNPGLIKAALMQTAIELDVHDILRSARGYIDVGQAWHEILNAATVNGQKHLGAVNPTQLPYPVWDTLIQGQIAEYYLTTVTPYSSGGTLEVTGTAAPFITTSVDYQHWTKIFKVVFTINATTPIGIYTGQINLKHDGITLDTTDIEFEVISGLGKRMLFNRQTTDWTNDHERVGQYLPFVEDTYSNGYSICEQIADLDSGILDFYDAVWLMDPFGYDYPLIELLDTTETTYNEWSTSEKAALTTYVENGGSVFLCFNGFAGTVTNDLGTFNTGENVSAINDWTTQWGITVSDVEYAQATVPIAVKGIHALAAGVDAIDHTGTTLTISSNATSLTETTDGSAFDALAVYQHSSGGRVIVLTTNFCLDSAGYVNGYNPGETQNDVFGQNLVRWVTAEHRIERMNISSLDKTITIRYKYVSGPGADFGGYVVKPDDTQVDLVWTEVSSDIWEASIIDAKEGSYEFFVECGPTGTDEFDYYDFFYEKTGGLGLEFVAISLITAIGLAGWYIIQKRRK